ncbi:MAG: amidohydrolase family protein [Acidobacteria bacterium]|nr:amidohydrolase family protein [Acidobacteriota bacterium]
MNSRVWLTFLMVAVPCLGLAQTADLILYNGKVVTVDENFTTAAAIALRADKILAVGTSEEMLRRGDAVTQKIDLKGKTVIPGLIDTHSHFHQYGRSHYRNALGAGKLREYPIDWSLVKTEDDVLKQIAATLKQYSFKPGEWVFFTAANWGDSELHRIYYEDLTMKDLDKVTPQNPIVISQGGGTIIYEGIALVNSRAWEILWGKYRDFLEKYGRYWKDSSGNPTGILESPAHKLLEQQLLPMPSPQILAPMLKQELEEWSAMGVTTVSSRMGSHDVEALRMLEQNHQLKVRIPYGNEDFFSVEDPETFFQQMGNVTGNGSLKLWLISFSPIVADGGGPRAATDFKRIQEFGQDGKYFPVGQPFLDAEYRGAKASYYKDWLWALARSGNRIANTHIAGDRTVRQMLDVMEAIDREVPLKDKRWAFDHCRLINPADIPRSVKLGVYWSCNPSTLNSAPEIEKVYGEKVAHTSYFPIKSLLDRGARVVFEMDGHRNIWGDLELLFTRTIKDKVYGPQERIDKVTGLKMITRWAAEYVLREKELGSLEPGKKADLVVLDRDYLTIPEEEVSEVQALMTLCDGEITHVHPQFSEEYQLRPPGVPVATYRQLAGREKLEPGSE